MTTIQKKLNKIEEKIDGDIENVEGACAKRWDDIDENIVQIEDQLEKVMQQQLKVEREKETGWKKIIQQELNSSSFAKQDKDRKKNIPETMKKAQQTIKMMRN